MRYEVEFWFDEDGDALHPAIRFVGNTTAYAKPFKASVRAKWETWRQACLSGRHKLQQYVLDNIGCSPEQTIAAILNAEKAMDYESTNHDLVDPNQVVYHES